MGNDAIFLRAGACRSRPGAAIIDVYNGSAEVYYKDYHSPLPTGHEG